MLHVDKLQDLGTVALLFQKLCTQRVGIQRSHPFFDQAIMQHRLQQIILHLLIQLMLAAWYRQNDFRAPAHSLRQCVIRCGIAGMECYNHIHMIHALIGRNIAMVKLKFVVSILLCKLLAAADDILL